VSLYRKYILSAIAVVFVVIGIFSWQSYEINRRLVEEAKEQRVALLAEIVSNGLKTIMLDGKTKDEFQRFIEVLLQRISSPYVSFRKAERY